MPGPCPISLLPGLPAATLPPAVNSQLGCLSDDSNYRWHLCSAVVAQIVEFAFNEGDLDSTAESGRSPGQGNGKPLQDFCLQNFMHRRGWRVMVHGVAESDITERLTLNTYSVLSGSKGCQQQRIHTSSAPHPAVSWTLPPPPPSPLASSRGHKDTKNGPAPGPPHSLCLCSRHLPGSCIQHIQWSIIQPPKKVHRATCTQILKVGGGGQWQGRGRGGQCFKGTEFQFGKMRKFWRWMMVGVGMAAPTMWMCLMPLSGALENG